MFMLDKDWQAFASIDSFNNNFVEGYICHKNNNLYGALYIERVNETSVPQLILCTPKLSYPFDKSGNWHFPKAKQILRYEKLDGTNIFAFRYFDSSGKRFTTYKTRLVAILKDSRFGPFLQMWQLLLRQQPVIAKLPEELDMNLSFEMWGARNSHLIIYDVPLKASLLFARHGQSVLPPQQLNVDSSLTAPYKGQVDSDYMSAYQQTQQTLDKNLRELEGNVYSGSEGEVWYLQDEKLEWQMFKCKPEQIEQIHWSQGGVSKNAIISTCENAFENWDTPTVENIKQLLLEEFSVSEVEKVHFSIEKYLFAAQEKHFFKQQVFDYYKTIGLSILENKVDVLRSFSKHFSKKDMPRVYSILASEIGK